MRWWELGLVSRHIGHEFSPANLRCPYCPNRENFARIFRVERRGEDTQEDHTSDVWQCRQCSEVVFVQWHTEKGMVDFRVYPQNIRLGLEGVLPSDLNIEYQQAISAFLSENWDITVVLLKRLIDLVAQELGIQGKDLRVILGQLVQQGQLTQGIQDWAKQIEILNPETSSTQVATQESARELLSFVRWVLDMIYLLPHTIERYRQK
jgi:hypothetical protein